jgi:hypothetical protein
MPLFPVTGEAAVVARLERGTVDSGGVFTLDIDADGAAPGAQPDLSPLQKDFVILGTGTQSETSFVNGRRSDRQRWSVKLRARRAGPGVIPAITVGSEHTEALPLTVAAPSPREAAEIAGHVFVEAGIAGAPRPVYVQQQVPYVVRLYYDDTIQRGELGAPAATDAVVEQLGNDQRGTATRNGHTYNVIERTYALSPEKSGTLHVPPVIFNGSRVVQTEGQGQRTVDPGDDMMARMLRDSPFANDPMLRGALSRMPFADAEEPVTAQGSAVVLDVKPRPAGVRGDWLPAQAIALHDSWQDRPPRLKAGEPATRIITIEAKGLSASQIPPLTIADPLHARIYPAAADNQSRTDGKTIFGISTQKITYIPNADGTLDVPPVVLSWWDVDSNTPRQAILPALTLAVAPGVVTAGATDASAATAMPTTEHSRTDAAAAVPGLTDRRPWIVGGGLLAAVLLAFGVFVGRRHLRARDDRASHTAAVQAPIAVSLRALRQACVANDAQGAAKALLEAARAQWPHDPPRGLRALALRLEEGAAAVIGLEHSLYGAGDVASWRGDLLLEIARRGFRPRRNEMALHDDGLAALYPSRPRRDLRT